MTQLAKLANKADEILALPEQIANLQAMALGLEEEVTKQLARVALYESQVEALRNKLHAYCVLTGDLKNAPEGCLRDRVRRLEEAMELEPLDVPEGAWKVEAGG
jgi:hypothetical protein